MQMPDEMTYYVAPSRKKKLASTSQCARLHDLTAAIHTTVVQVFRISAADIFSRSRGNAQVALARQVAMYLARVVGGMRLSEIGALFGRDRTTVAHACTVIENRRDDPGFNHTVDLLEAIVSRLRTVTRRFQQPAA